MAADADFLKTLQDKEAELASQLEQTPLWKQIMGIRSTIELFMNGESSKPTNGVSYTIVTPIETRRELEYSETGTWESKILFAMQTLGSGYVEDIMEVIKMHEGEVIDDDTLYKRVSQNCSVLKKNGKIDGVKKGLKVKYYKK